MVLLILKEPGSQHELWYVNKCYRWPQVPSTRGKGVDSLVTVEPALQVLEGFWLLSKHQKPSYSSGWAHFWIFELPFRVWGIRVSFRTEIIHLSFPSTLEIRQTRSHNRKKIKSLRLWVMPNVSNDSIMGPETKCRCYHLSCLVRSVRKRWRMQATHVDFVHSPGLERTEA